MSHYFEHPEFYDNPVGLSPEHQNDPIAFLELFFCDYHLSDLRGYQEEILEVCLTTDSPPFDNSEKRSDTILLHKNIELLFEAAFLVLKGNKADRLKKSKQGPADQL